LNEIVILAHGGGFIVIWLICKLQLWHWCWFFSSD